MSVARPVHKLDLRNVAVAVLGWLLSAVVVYGWAEYDRRSRSEEFALATERQVRELAAATRDAYDNVIANMLFATELLDAGEPHDHRGELAALLAVVRTYRALVVVDGSGRFALRVVKPPPATLDLDRIEATVLATTQESLQNHGKVAISPRIEGADNDSLRVFALAFSDRPGAIALIVDTRPLFGSARILRSDPTTRLLLLGSYGHPLPVSDDLVRDAIVDHRLQPLHERMRSNEVGTETIPAELARGMSLDDGEMVVSWVTIDLNGRPRWTVAAFRSMEDLHHRQQELTLQMIGLLSALAVLFAFVGLRATRRAREETALRERLQHAEREAALRNELLRAEKLATVGVLAAGVAHEIGTPLGIIRGRAEYVASKLGAEHPHEQSLRNIISQIDRVTSTVQELLDFARPPTTSSPPYPTSVKETATAAMTLLQLSDRRRREALRLVVDDDLPVLTAPDEHVRQVLVNLCMNALDACAEADEPTVRIEVRRDPEQPDRVRIVVEDNGCGVPEELRHRIFDPFFTTKKRGRGTGLGLAVVSRIVDTYGATLKLESEPGRFTRFTTSWPSATGAP
ncbi:MAG: GHKL domain-containing protein [Deltaproteobacteria bacterium]|nr:GHKL domain-containing protein [Deltaproteobacteria bacterium]